MGQQFQSQSDTEVLLKGYAALGAAILDKLNGIFAFAIHDHASGEVFVARDQLGIKPLYYTEGPQDVAFASEIKALLHLGVADREIDMSAIRKYLTFLWCPGDQTPFSHVKKLDPGAAMIIRDGAIVRRWTWWVPPAYQPRAGWTARDCADELRAKVDACVERQLVSDAPVGSFLSGGLDSSAIVAAARQTAPDIRCFTINTTEIEEGATDDLPYARAVAAHLGVRLEEIRVGAGDLCARVEEMVRHLDEPLADPACLNVQFISELARSQGVKVLLSGAGGDDLLTGYRRHTMLALTSGIPSPARSLLGRLSSRINPGSALGRRLNKALYSAGMDGDQRISRAFAWGPPGIADHLLSADTRAAAPADDVFAPLTDLLLENENLPDVEKCLTLERRFFLADHNLNYTDKMAMAAGVEVRVPLLDMEMVSFAAEIPVNWKHHLLTPKWIFKQAEKPRLPLDIINRPKTGFGAPLRRWMRQDMREMVEALLSPAAINARGLFDAREVARLREADRRGEVDGSYTLFAIMCSELWCRSYVDAPR